MITDDRLCDYSFLRRLVLDKLTRVNGSKTPGYPLNLTYGTNHAVLEDIGAFHEVLDAAVARAHMWCTVTDEELRAMREDPFLMVAWGYRDPSSIFIKDEPHPRRKVVDKRYRCITPVSLVDQCCEYVVAGEMSGIMKRPENLFASGSAIGIGFSDSQNQQVREFLFRESEDKIAGDFSGFDAQHTEQSLDAVRRIEARRFGLSGPHGRGHEFWFTSMAHSVSVFGGSLVSKTKPGMMDSGSLRTSDVNTGLCTFYWQAAAVKAGERDAFVMAAGDDSVIFRVKDPGRLVTGIRSLGCVVRDVEVSSDSIEFCSHLYCRDDPGVPLTSYAKAIYRLLSVPELDKYDSRQTVQEMRHNTDLYPVLMDWLDEAAPL